MAYVLSHVLGAVLYRLRSSPGGRSLLYAAHRRGRPQTGWNQKVVDADSRLPHHQPIRGCPWADHAPLLQHSKTPHYPSSGRGTVFRALTHCGCLCLAKQYSYFFLSTQNCLCLSIWHQWTEAKFWQQKALNELRGKWNSYHILIDLTLSLAW